MHKMPPTYESLPETKYRVLLVAPAYFFGVDRADQMVSFTSALHDLESTAILIARDFCKNAPAVVSIQVQQLPSGEITHYYRGLLSDAEFIEQRKQAAAEGLANWSDFSSSTAH
jgi:hypothetical protein